MRRWVVAGLAALAVLAVTAEAGEAWYRYRWSGGVYIGGPWYWPGPFYGYGGGYPYLGLYSYPYGYAYPYGWGYPYGPYSYPSTIVVEPPVYIERGPPAPTSPPAPKPPTAYWYYCVSSRTYYPDVQACAEEWVKVLPRQP